MGEWSAALGVSRLDALGVAHTLVGVAALACGCAVLLRQKGTRWPPR